jgi:hypothetical protein
MRLLFAQTLTNSRVSHLFPGKKTLRELTEQNESPDSSRVDSRVGQEQPSILNRESVLDTNITGDT